MSQIKQYKSDAFAAIHETMDALYEVGAVDKKTMRHFDESCIESARIMQPHEIKALRERENVSQPVFALYLSVSRNTISDWERGVKNPSGPALRLLHIAQENGIDALVSLPTIVSEYHDDEEGVGEVLDVLRSIQSELRKINKQVHRNSADLRQLKRTTKSHGDGVREFFEGFEESPHYTGINEIPNRDTDASANYNEGY